MVNRSYQELATHYGAVVIPARPYKARDKAKVESMVLVAQRWILARIRNCTFFSLDDLNVAISKLLEDLNARPMQKIGVSRRELFERLDRPALKPLPVSRYEMAQWTTCRVNIFCGVRPYVAVGEVRRGESLASSGRRPHKYDPTRCVGTS